MSLISYIGHEGTQRRLEKFLEHGGESRSFLFYGPKYSGKHTLAQIFSGAFVRGEKRLDFSEKGGSDTLGDIIVIAPIVEEKKGIVKEKQIDIDGVREGIRNIALSSSHCGRKVLLIDEAQKMTAQAQNALLKTLEEPVGSSLIILVAHTTDTILPTILSRCEQVRFGNVSKSEFRLSFTAPEGVSAEELWKISLGLPGFAIRLLQEKKFLNARLVSLRDAERIDSMGVGERLRLGEALSKNIPKAIEVLELWAFVFRDKGLSGTGEIKALFLRAEKMYECARLLKNTQVNGRLILENAILSL